MKKVLALSAVLAASATALAQWSDNFNAPNGPLGPNWTVVSGTWGIDNNQGVHLSSPANETIQYGPASLAYGSSVSSLDIFATSTASQFSALLTGLGGTDTLMVKIQAQTSTGQFSHVGFYHKTSATAYGNWTPGVTTLPDGTTNATTGFVTMPAGYTFASARMSVWFPDLDTVQLDLDTDFNGTIDQTYKRTGLSSFAANLGTGHGIAAWGTTARFDNWSVVPEPASLALLGVGALLTALRRR